MKGSLLPYEIDAGYLVQLLTHLKPDLDDPKRIKHWDQKRLNLISNLEKHIARDKARQAAIERFKVTCL